MCSSWKRENFNTKLEHQTRTPTGTQGFLCDYNGTNCETFTKNCLPYTGDAASSGDLLREKNPVCNSIQYSGGLSICKHKRILLDEDQEIRPELLRYHMKYRFWFRSTFPRMILRTHLIQSSYLLPNRGLGRRVRRRSSFSSWVDLSIPGYPDHPWKLSPGSSCTETVERNGLCVSSDAHVQLTVSSFVIRWRSLPCPSCWYLVIVTIRTWDGLLVINPIYGKGNVEKDKFDEFGYVTLPCLWGEDEGLEPSILLPPNTPLVSIRRTSTSDISVADWNAWNRCISHFFLW